MSLTPNQIRERLGSKYPWPLRDNFVPTVFSDCVSWEQQVLWLYRFILGVYLELQDEGYLTIDEVLQDSPAAVKSSGIWAFVTNAVSDLGAKLYQAIQDGDEATAAKAASDLEAAVRAIGNAMATLKTGLEEAIQAGDAATAKKAADDLQAAVTSLTATIQELNTTLSNEIASGDKATADKAASDLETAVSTINTTITGLSADVTQIQQELETLSAILPRLEVFMARGIPQYYAALAGDRGLAPGVYLGLITGGQLVACYGWAIQRQGTAFGPVTVSTSAGRKVVTFGATKPYVTNTDDWTKSFAIPCVLYGGLTLKAGGQTYAIQSDGLCTISLSEDKRTVYLDSVEFSAYPDIPDGEYTL